jgi:hypothetical protein
MAGRGRLALSACSPQLPSSTTHTTNTSPGASSPRIPRFKRLLYLLSLEAIREVLTMRLLQLKEGGALSLVEVQGNDIPPYAILSHTWGSDKDEVNFQDLEHHANESKAGYCKLSFCGEQAKKDGLEYFWVDTCCTIQTHHRRQCTTKSAAYVAESGGTMYIAF